ncbi:MAG: ROK family protein [Prevotella sp.]|nr:ROK family protein [Prevotella sp.]
MEEIDQIKTRVVGIDVRETRTTYAVVDIKGEIIAQDYFLTTDYPDVSDYVAALTEKIVILVEENGGYETIRSIGISAPSGNYLTGCIENAANLSWKGVVPLAAMLQDRLGLAVALANDAHITALGEKAFGSAHGMKDFVVVSISHGGLGSCIFTDGKPHLGVNGFAGEVGHTCVELNGRECGCGRKGCLETYVSDKGLVRTVEELLAESNEPTLLSELDDINIKTIADSCDKGDRLAIEAFKRVGSMLGLGLANYASVLNPEAIILTGDMTQAGKWLLKPMRTAFDEHIFHNIRGKVRILVSILKEGERDVLGASALAWDVKEYSLFK